MNANSTTSGVAWRHLKQRPWEYVSEAPDTLADRAENPAEAISRETGLSLLTAKVCVQRGLKSADQVRAFLSPRLEGLTDPYKIRDMTIAVDRLVQARSEGERVLIFGDYDVDGTTGAALLSWGFRDFGIQYEAVQPDRFKDGYGLNVGAIEAAHGRGIRLVVTIDCGITSFAAAQRASELGMDLIVVDHHQVDPEKGLPKATAILNPQRADCESGLKMLCGCGLGFYLLRALRTRGKQDGWWTLGQEPNLKRHLDLVVMATAADMVPLMGDNHILARHGLEVLKFTKKPGVRALLDVCGISEKADHLSPSHLGFSIGPRINASGRLKTAGIALSLLSTEDPVQATELSLEIEKLNKERMEIQNQIWDQVKKVVEQGLAEGKFQNAIVVGDETWHEGVVGIVASRVTETFHRPAVVLSFRGDHAKGSVRTYAGKDVLEALRKCAVHLNGFGGHRHAAGVNLSVENLAEFQTAFNEALSPETLGIAGVEDPEALALQPLKLDAKVRLEDLRFSVLQEIERLGPFGPGNPEPVFSVTASARQVKVLKERHYKFQLVSQSASPRDLSLTAGSLMESIWFYAAKDVEAATLSEPAEWAGVAELNRFNGRVTPTFRVKDRKPTSLL
ncbi:MAG: single-stranded-DNA-specific exonuclease RecJ [Bdellovibrionales bacterium]|nr:single-stranded-DNA-specific exonuclease RecJ [Bdellovibrionales bacterium]